MAESQVISGLVSKYSELAGKIDYHQNLIKQVKADQGAIATAIKLFDAEYDLRSIKGKRIVAKNTLFTDSEGSRLVLEALRELEGTPTTGAIIDHIQLRMGKDYQGDELNRFKGCVGKSLQRFRQRGMIEQAGKDGVSCMWKLAQVE